MKTLQEECPEEAVEIIKDLFLLEFKIHCRMKFKYVKKLQWIFVNQISSEKRSRQAEVCNYEVLDDIQLPGFVVTALNYGPQFHVGVTKPWDRQVSQLERLISRMDETQKEEVRWKCALAIKSSNSNRGNGKKVGHRKLEIACSLTRRWLSDEAITCTRDDKSKKLVFLKRASYVKYIEQCLEEMKAEELPGDPTEEQQRRVFRLSRRKDLPDFLKFRCIMNPTCPRLFAYIKLHKQPITARPIVERFFAPTYPLREKTCCLV